jgi:hypothetical protein
MSWCPAACGCAGARLRARLGAAPATAAAAGARLAAGGLAAEARLETSGVPRLSSSCSLAWVCSVRLAIARSRSIALSCGSRMPWAAAGWSAEGSLRAEGREADSSRGWSTCARGETEG